MAYTDDKDFLHERLENPHYSLIPQMYADWLQDRVPLSGEPVISQEDQHRGLGTFGNSVRSEFIRFQAIANGSDSSEERHLAQSKADELYALHGADLEEWLQRADPVSKKLFRLSYADWLDHHAAEERSPGNPPLTLEDEQQGLGRAGESSLGAYMRHLARLPSYRSLENAHQLHQRYAVVWDGPIIDAGGVITRDDSGQAIEVSLVSLDFQRLAEVLSTVQPHLKSVCLSADADDGYMFSAEALRNVAQVPEIRRLTALSLDNGLHFDVCDAGLRELIHSGALNNIKRFSLSNNMLSDNSVQLISTLPHLEELDLSKNHFDRDGIRALASMSTLRKLNLSYIIPEDAPSVVVRDFTSLFTSRSLSGLQELRLAKCEINDRYLQHYLEHTTLDCLESLDLSLNPITESGYHALATSDLAKKLSSLVLGGAEFTNQGLRALVANDSKFLQLHTLQVNSGRISEEGIADLAQSKMGRQLQSLTFFNTRRPLSPHSLSSIAGMEGLKRLSLCYNNISDSGVEALANGKLTNLDFLDLRNNTITRDGMRSLAQSTSFSDKMEINVGDFHGTFREFQEFERRQRYNLQVDRPNTGFSRS